MRKYNRKNKLVSKHIKTSYNILNKLVKNYQTIDKKSINLAAQTKILDHIDNFMNKLILLN